MKKILKTFALGVMVSLLTACGELKLDTSSEEAMEASIEKIMAELSPDKQKDLLEAFVDIYMLGEMDSFGNEVSASDVKAKTDAKLNGKTAREVFILANEIREKLKNQE